jgi:hypothetical protein
MPAKTIQPLCEGAVKNSVCVQRHRISQEDAEGIREAEKRSHNGAVKLVLEILFKKLTGRRTKC